RDAAAQIAEPAVEGEPALARDDLELERLAFRQSDERLGSRPELPEHGAERGQELLLRDGRLLEPAPVAVPEVALARQRFGEQLVRSLVDGLVVPARPDSEDALDLVGVGEALAGEPPSDRQEPPRLRGNPGAPLGREVAALEVGEQRPRLLDEPRRLERPR